MVFKKQLNEDGIYLDQEGNHWEILSCEVTESLEWQETGEYETIIDEEGHEIQVPIMAQVVVINKGWDAFDSLKDAIEAYGLIDPNAEESESVEELPVEEAI